MVNVPLIADRLALRLVGFTAEDAGFIDNVLSDSGGGTFTNADLVDDDVNSAETSGARAALRWDVTDDVDVTLGALFQDLSTDGHGDVNIGVGDLNQVRFEDESLDDKWYQVALTLNASLGFGDLILSASYFDRDFHYEADATAYEFNFNQNFINCVPDAYYDCTSPVYDFGGDPRGFATNDEQIEITTFEARLQSPSDSESRWAWLVGAFYSEEKEHTEFDSFVRGYENTGPSGISTTCSTTSMRSVLAADGTLVSGPLRHRARAGCGVRRALLRPDRELHDHGGRALVRLRPQVRTASGTARGVRRVFPAGRQPGLE